MKTVIVGLVLVLLLGVILAGCKKRPVQKDETKMPISFSDKLLKERAILLGSPIGDEEATEIIAKLLFLEKLATNAPITLYINSPGGSVTAGLAIINTMESLKAPVHTFCVGQAHSMAAIILATGSPGKRSAATNAIISFSEIVAGGDLTPDKQANIEKLKAVLLEKTSRRTNMSTKQVKELFASGRLLTPTEAKDLCIIDDEVNVVVK